jgi:hypothetical protein
VAANGAATGITLELHGSSLPSVSAPGRSRVAEPLL